MMYLVLVRPLMLPKGYNDIVNELTSKQANNFFHPAMRSKRITEARTQFITTLLSDQACQSLEIYGLTTCSRIEKILPQGLFFMKKLQDLVLNDRWDHDEKWEVINQVWLEMLIQAASQCLWKEHAQQLRHGGELLTHVALLMARFGSSTKIQKKKNDEDDEF